MDGLSEIYAKIANGEEISEEEFNAVRAAQEMADDLLETIEGRKRGVRPDDFPFRSLGPGFAIVVGHTANAPGATGTYPISQSEYPWNKDLAQRMRALCQQRGVESKIFYRDGVGISGAYRQVRDWGAACVVELHFNAFNGQARGTETLLDVDTNAGSRAWAQRLQEGMLDTLGLSNRGLKECDAGDRGFGSVSTVDIPSALIEPFFGDNTQDAQIAFNNKDELAAALVDAAQAQLAVA